MISVAAGFVHGIYMYEIYLKASSEKTSFESSESIFISYHSCFCFVILCTLIIIMQFGVETWH